MPLLTMQVPFYYPIEPALGPSHTCHAAHFLSDAMLPDNMCAGNKVYLVEGIEGLAIYYKQWVIFRIYKALT
jgi:hypothetical protein